MGCTKTSRRLVSYTYIVYTGALYWYTVLRNNIIANYIVCIGTVYIGKYVYASVVQYIEGAMQKGHKSTHFHFKIFTIGKQFFFKK